jgi:hypothetical protein
MRMGIAGRVLVMVVTVAVLGFALGNVALAEGKIPRGPTRPGGTGVVEGVVYQDWNQDGERDTQEPGLPGATVMLYDLWSNLVSETVTDEDGAYRLSATARGYLLTVMLPEGYTALQETIVPVIVRSGETTTRDFGTVLLLCAP